MGDQAASVPTAPFLQGLIVFVPTMIPVTTLSNLEIKYKSLCVSNIESASAL